MSLIQRMSSYFVNIQKINNNNSFLEHFHEYDYEQNHQIIISIEIRV